ncbi:hypothetical protein CW696_02575 [ANME-2 cluster archaeon]|nr:MAG: hypothetical protein CW696_02575 [ANME-2 cluster archaeon]
MFDEKKDGIDLDYVLLAAGLAGALTAIATATTLLARPMLIDAGKHLPLPTINSIMGEDE